MKTVARWSATKTLAPLDQQISNFAIVAVSSAVTRDTVIETRGNCGAGARWIRPIGTWRHHIIVAR